MAITTTDWVITGGVCAGLIGYFHVVQKKKDRERQVANNINRALALGNQAVAQGNAAAAAILAAAGRNPAGRNPPPPPAPASPSPSQPSSPPPPVAAPSLPSLPAPIPTAHPAAPHAASVGINRAFDEVFARHGMGMPVAYLRALAQYESGMNPQSPLGLINVTSSALKDFNRRNPGRRIKPWQMRNPTINVEVAADTLREIIASYARNHGDVATLRADWTSRYFVELLTYGWTAGHSEASGVGRVVRYLKAQPVGSRPTLITAAGVHAWAARAQASHWLQLSTKLLFSQRVAATYFREVARDRLDGVAAATA